MKSLPLLADTTVAVSTLTGLLPNKNTQRTIHVTQIKDQTKI